MNRRSVSLQRPESADIRRRAHWLRGALALLLCGALWGAIGRSGDDEGYVIAIAESDSAAVVSLAVTESPVIAEASGRAEDAVDNAIDRTVADAVSLSQAAEDVALASEPAPTVADVALWQGENSPAEEEPAISEARVVARVEASIEASVEAESDAGAEVATTAIVVGIASTYNPLRKHAPTASGEFYDAETWTAAIQIDLRQHFGGVRFGRLYRPAFALVESGGKRAIVKINDVGPLRPGRVIDLNERSMRHFDPSLRHGLVHGMKVTLLQGDHWAAGPVSSLALTSAANAM